MSPWSMHNGGDKCVRPVQLKGLSPCQRRAALDRRQQFVILFSTSIPLWALLALRVSSQLFVACPFAEWRTNYSFRRFSTLNPWKVLLSIV